MVTVRDAESTGATQTRMHGVLIGLMTRLCAGNAAVWLKYGMVAMIHLNDGGPGKWPTLSGFGIARVSE